MAVKAAGNRGRLKLPQLVEVVLEQSTRFVRKRLNRRGIHDATSNKPAPFVAREKTRHNTRVLLGKNRARRIDERASRRNARCRGAQKPQLKARQGAVIARLNDRLVKRPSGLWVSAHGARTRTRRVDEDRVELSTKRLRKIVFVGKARSVEFDAGYDIGKVGALHAGSGKPGLRRD